ncbi:MAG TPA: thioredoxin-dependent thiol peroxidase [Bacteroidales bacterium]
MTTLKVGDKAPEFKAIDQEGKSISLADYKGKKVILYFYPKDNTPGCTDEACSLRDGYQDLLKHGYDVIGISADSTTSHQGFIKKFNLPFRLISDPDKMVIQAYGAWGEKKMYGKSYEGIIRTTFIIGSDGKIESVIDKVKTKDHATQILQG